MTPLTDRCDEAMARAIWNIRREDEDKCNMELEDMGPQHSVWEEARAARLALLAALDAEGWQWVPKMATAEMVVHGNDKLPTQFSELGHEDAPREIYAAMLCAAPNPFKESSE